eukprot:TRINITY_DN62535_c0_g1_i1.p1 TRINITY_DN62535_c0_g1~~TRINITY_DN62535_c0_g1_i1.p1  ORF type:complete len:180 (+),score=35.61 TRINITY_DN62535_c0_g1_i1:258-797(+)
MPLEVVLERVVAAFSLERGLPVSPEQEAPKEELEVDLFDQVFQEDDKEPPAMMESDNDRDDNDTDDESASPSPEPPIDDELGIGVFVLGDSAIKDEDVKSPSASHERFCREDHQDMPTKPSPAQSSQNGARGGPEASQRDWREKSSRTMAVSYTHLRAHETPEHLVCRLLLEKKTINHR